MFCTHATTLPSRNDDRLPFSNLAGRNIFGALLLLLLTPALLSAQAVFTNLIDFDSTNGDNPLYVYLVQGTDGQLYGTTANGDGLGNAFKITTTGTITQVYKFCSLPACADGMLPNAGLVMGPNGSFYGTTTCTNNCLSGPGGTIFELTPAGTNYTFTLLHTFQDTDGSYPVSNMTLGTDGNFYGTTLYGGNLALCGGLGCGTVFRITPAGKFTSLYTFQGPDGSNPTSRLFQGINGNFYGTTTGDSSGGGTIFEITPSGKLTTLYNFGIGSNPSNPYGGVVQTSNGTIYGTTAYGGTNSTGTFFKLIGKKLTVLYNFCSLPSCADGNYPYSGLIQATDGNFYGTTLGAGTNVGGTVYEFILPNTFKTLYSFCSQTNCPDGALPYGGGLLQATDGNFYGTTSQGGEMNQYGTIFKISNGLAPFVQTVTSAAKVGARVTILGTSLTGTTAVSFNGTSATFVVPKIGTYLIATVPAGATTGPVNVTTPGGTLVSNASFKIFPQILSFSPSSGSVGTSVTITGVSLTQTQKVTFGGVSATFTVNSDTQITAIVPAGALTGKIAVATPGGTALSTTTFTVN